MKGFIGCKYKSAFIYTQDFIKAATFLFSDVKSISETIQRISSNTKQKRLIKGQNPQTVDVY